MSSSNMGWELVDHACRLCLGRLLMRVDAMGKVEVMCAECETSAAANVESLCCCGADCRSHGRILECYKNGSPSKHAPQAVLVRERAV